MKTLLLIRHAKSSWEEPGLGDFERPLNDRGKKDAPEMAQRLKNKKVEVDHFVTSPAKRAYKTAKIFAEAYNVKKDQIQQEKQLYLADPEEFKNIIASLDNAHKTVAIFSHNPGITEFANSLTTVRIDNMPTCSIFAVVADVEEWKDFDSANKRLLFFDYPKNVK